MRTYLFRLLFLFPILGIVGCPAAEQKTVSDKPEAKPEQPDAPPPLPKGGPKDFKPPKA